MKVNQRPAEATVQLWFRYCFLEVRTVLSHQEQDVILIRSQKRNVQNLIVSGYSQDDVWCQWCANLDTRLSWQGLS